ncbi:MAG: Stk1 family PASTA domain-containing Ser/Thr kinase [Lachnospiraceae bacterium]|jgi:serine/threonine protein kinase|nr:Stk1 family PASTA domain-containing Ser/Thr kinase [Lachnospiraceae bacterium]
MLTNGTILNDRYEILSKVGSGGMSDVYKAKCHKLNRYVAIKVLKSEFSEDRNFVSKFRAEAQAAAALSHPNIVNIYDVGEENGLYYIVMELVEGITLKKYIDKKGRIDVKEAVSIAIQVAQGIQTAHSHHIIHRDIKPQNIIISREGKVKVTDFGIARASSSQTISSNAVGSVYYISPEQARGSYSDERSDIYSLGITLYEMVTGMLPFEGDNTVAVALQHIQNELPSPRDYTPDLPISVEKIIYKCTQKKPERRYAKASDVIADLKKSLITPDEDFVQLIPVNPQAPTISLTEEEVTVLKKNSNREEENERPVLPKSKANPNSNFYKEEVEEGDRVNPKVEKMMTILSVVAAVLIVCLLIFIIMKMMPKGNNNENPTSGQTTSTLDTSTVPTSSTVPAQTETTTNGVNMVTVPSVVGFSEADALISLNQMNLGITVTGRESSDTIEAGKIIRQEVEAGTSIARNSTIGVVVSTGPEKFSMLDVSGKTEQSAIAALKDKELEVTSEYIYSDEIEKGIVISSNPTPNTMIMKKDKVTITVSMGPEFKEVPVPDVKGMTLEEAKLALEKEGFILGKTEEAESTEVAAGKIISQNLEAGKIAKQGTSVNLVVSKGKVTFKGSLTINLSQVSQYITDDGNNFAEPISPGVINPPRYGDATLRLELSQTTEDGKTILRDIEKVTVNPSSFPYTKNDIIGETGLYEGSVRVYLTFGGVEHDCGSCLVDFQ